MSIVLQVYCKPFDYTVELWASVQVGEFGFYRDQLWTAPELLRMTTRPINGTQKADVYSFAIILQEIMFRAEPYFINVDHPQSATRQNVFEILTFRAAVA